VDLELFGTSQKGCGGWYGVCPPLALSVTVGLKKTDLGRILTSTIMLQPGPRIDPDLLWLSRRRWFGKEEAQGAATRDSGCPIPQIPPGEVYMPIRGDENIHVFLKVKK